jgi:hypothetical protein
MLVLEFVSTGERMSRGLGKVQRALLAILTEFELKAGPRELEQGLDTITLAHRAYGRPIPEWFKLVTTAQEIATRRALAGLARNGMVICMGTLGIDDRRQRWRRGLG